MKRPTSSRLKPVLQGYAQCQRDTRGVRGDTRGISRTGFSREEASCNTINPAARRPTSSRLKPVLQGYARCQRDTRGVSRTGFSREEASRSTFNSAARRPTCSRLKPVLQGICAVSEGCARCQGGYARYQWDRLQPGRGQLQHHQFCGATTDVFPAKASPTRAPIHNPTMDTPPADLPDLPLLGY